MKEFKCKISMINLATNSPLEMNTSLFGNTYKEAVQSMVQVHKRIGYKLTRIICL